MNIRGVGAIWLTPENYERFVEVCDDEVHPNYAAWRANADNGIARLVLTGQPVPDKLLVDVNDMAAWCKATFGKVDSQSRAAYASYLMAKRDSEGADAS